MVYGQGVREEMPRYLLIAITPDSKGHTHPLHRNWKIGWQCTPTRRPKDQAGVNNYCRVYFTNEIANEFVGLAPEAICRSLIGKMTRLPPRRRFNRSDIEGLFADDLREEKNSASTTCSCSCFTRGRSPISFQVAERIMSSSIIGGAIPI